MQTCYEGVTESKEKHYYTRDDKILPLGLAY